MKEGFELHAIDVSVCRKGRLILDGVSFKAKPGKLTAIIGPNGAGKTTLMRALSGERPDQGQVYINGQDLYAEPEYWLQKIGYVPADNILHEHLTLEEALIYIAQLRLPDASLDQVKSKVDDLLSAFGFPHGDARRHKQIRVLSSGERKRANICSELIIDPPILMLDEPTSNLDPDAEWNLMTLLSKHASDYGQTILVITHTLNTIQLCDEVIFLENARKRAAGTHLEVLEMLEKEVPQVEASENSTYDTLPAQVVVDYTTPATTLFARWAKVFSSYKTDEDARTPCNRISGDHDAAGARSLPHQARSVPWFDQLRHLLARYHRSRRGDRWSFIGTLLAGFSGILFFILPGSTFVKPFEPSEIGLALNQARQSVYIVSLVATLIGLITSYTEISREYRIYRHERMKGLSPSAYFVSKWLWLTVAVGILAPLVLLCFIVLVYQQPLPGFPEPRIGETVGWWERLIRFQLMGLLTSTAGWLILINLVLACITSVTLGLLISTIAGDSGRGYLYLSFAVVFIVLFSGLIRNEKLEALVDTFSFASTGKWAYEGMASSLNVYCWQDSWRFDEFNSAGHVVSILLSLAAYCLISAFLAFVVLRSRDPWYGRLTNLGQLIRQDWVRIAVYLSIAIALLSYAVFLRHNSQDYHLLTYFSSGGYGGTSAYEYANVSKARDLSWLQVWNGRVSQSWCGDQ